MGVFLTKRRLIGALGIIVAVTACTSETKLLGASYQFTSVASSSATGGFGLSVPSINGSGTVAYVDTSPNTNSLYTWSAGIRATVVTSSSYFQDYDAGTSLAPTINNSGVVAFNAFIQPTSGSITNNEGIVTGTQAGLTTVVSGASPVGTGGFTKYSVSPQISGNGTIAFAASHSTSFQGTGVYTGNGGTLTQIAANANLTAVSADPALSDNGTLAYEWPTVSGGNLLTGDNVYLMKNGITTPVASVSGDFYQGLAVNDSGEVATLKQHAIQLASGGSITTIASSATGGFSIFENVSMNNSGAIVFDASLQSGRNGIFNGGDPVANKIIETGDAFDGSTVTVLGLGNEAIDNNGDVVFWAKLADGRQGIFVTSTVPEPATGFTLIGCIALLIRRRRRN